MQLTKKELELIENAEKSLKDAKIRHMMLLVVLIASLVLMLIGVLHANFFAFIAIGSVFIATFFNFGGTHYEQIVELLSRVRSESEAPVDDPLIDALSKRI